VPGVVGFEKKFAMEGLRKEDAGRPRCSLDGLSKKMSIGEVSKEREWKRKISPKRRKKGATERIPSTPRAAHEHGRRKKSSSTGVG